MTWAFGLPQPVTDTRPTAEDRRNAVDLLAVAEGCAACRRSARRYRGFRRELTVPRQWCPKKCKRCLHKRAANGWTDGFERRVLIGSPDST